MTNLDIESLGELRDLESLNAWQDLVEERKVFTPDEMMAAIRKKGRDNARSPMQWENKSEAGFTSGRPWLKVNANYPAINAKDQLSDPDSVFHYYKKIISLRKELPVMVYGQSKELFPGHDQIFAWERTLGEERLIVVNNFSAQTASADISSAAGSEEFSLFIASYNDFTISGTGVYELRPYESFVLYNEAKEE